MSLNAGETTWTTPAGFNAAAAAAGGAPAQIRVSGTEWVEAGRGGMVRSFVPYKYPTVPYRTMQYHTVPCSTMQYHTVPCSTTHLSLPSSVQFDDIRPL